MSWQKELATLPAAFGPGGPAPLAVMSSGRPCGGGRSRRPEGARLKVPSTWQGPVPAEGTLRASHSLRSKQTSTLMLPRELGGGFRGGNQQSGPTTSDMPEPFTDPSGDGMEWLCKPAASEDNVCGWFTGCQSGPSKVLTSLTHRAARDAESNNRR